MPAPVAPPALSTEERLDRMEKTLTTVSRVLGMFDGRLDWLEERAQAAPPRGGAPRRGRSDP
ncbi:MAG: hypothetical protein IT376_09645 [Polyangiaceae bacterium]|nr:hypothetical protein [Polyangiaceae bacterium]